MSLQLRDYQEQAVDAVLGALAVHPSALFVAPTGAGKTQIFVAIAERRRPEGRTLVLAHREELIEQAAARFQEFTSLTTTVEMAERRADADADVVLASVQTLSRESRLARFRPDAFGLVITDEAHHVVAETYRRVLAHFPAAKFVGCTATPDRLDHQALGQIFVVCPFVYELRDAIEDGWLVPIRQVRVQVDGLDLSRVRVTAGDLRRSARSSASSRSARTPTSTACPCGSPATATGPSAFAPAASSWPPPPSSRLRSSCRRRRCLVRATPASPAAASGFLGAHPSIARRSAAARPGLGARASRQSPRPSRWRPATRRLRKR